MAQRDPVAFDGFKVDEWNQPMRLVCLIVIASAFMLMAQSAIAQRVLPSTLGKTVKVEYVGLIDTAPFTVLSFSPREFPVTRYGKRYPIDKMTVTFFAEGPLRHIWADVIHMPAGSGPPDLGGAGDPNSSAQFFGILPPCKPDQQFPVYEAGLHHCTYPLQVLFDGLVDPERWKPRQLKIGDRVGLILTVNGDPNKVNPPERSVVVISVPVTSADTAVRRSP